MISTHRSGGIAVAALVFGVDQLVKYAVTGLMGINHVGASIELLPFFDLTFVPNFGVALGMLEVYSPVTRWMLTAFLAAISLGVAWWMWREPNRLDVLGLGAVLGGALGNLLDRTRLGYVIDYADLHFGTFRPFLVFNVADAAITMGVLILLARALFASDAKPEVEK